MFGNFFKPEWYKKLPPHLQFGSRAMLTEMEAKRVELGLSHENAWACFVQSPWVVRRIALRTYAELKRTIPGQPESEYLAGVVGDRIVKKLGAISVNNSPTALDADELGEILENLGPITKGFRSVNDSITYLLEIEEREGSFDYCMGAIRQLDAVASRYPANC
jgi:hypothetical protein